MRIRSRRSKRCKGWVLEYLEADEADEKSSNDFGKNIIPNLLHNGEKLFAYKFAGYWKDVGTISSLWEANMDLIGDDPILSMNDSNFRIFSRNSARAPQYLGAKSEIVNSLVSEGCRINGTVINSILSGGVVIEEGAIVKDSVIMEDVVIGADAKVYTAILDAETQVEAGAVFGNEGAGKEGILITAKGTHISANKGGKK